MDRLHHVADSTSGRCNSGMSTHAPGVAVMPFGMGADEGRVAQHLFCGRTFHVSDGFAATKLLREPRLTVTKRETSSVRRESAYLPFSPNICCQPARRSRSEANGGLDEYAAASRALWSG
eukprot:2631446-Prymnesium_polylepis.2